MVAVVSIPTVHLWRFEEVLDRENIMRTLVGDCQVARSARLPAAAHQRALVERARVRIVG
jgi:hypothetical protein